MNVQLLLLLLLLLGWIGSTQAQIPSSACQTTCPTTAGYYLKSELVYICNCWWGCRNCGQIVTESRLCCTLCPVGHSCPLPATVSNLTPCPEGTYQDELASFSCKVGVVD